MSTFARLPLISVDEMNGCEEIFLTVSHSLIKQWLLINSIAVCLIGVFYLKKY